MKRAALASNAIQLPTLPDSRTTSIHVVDGRDRVARHGVFFTTIGRHRRSVVQQFDGSIELADACTCLTDWQPDFAVTRSVSCPLDQHRARAIQEDDAA